MHFKSGVVSALHVSHGVFDLLSPPCFRIVESYAVDEWSSESIGLVK